MTHDPICVIMQPTYLPWAGYFNLISRSDVFVFLDDVQFEKQSWQSRNRVLVNGRVHWLIVPIKHTNRNQSIYDIDIADDINWRKKHSLTLKQSYSKHPHFRDIIEIINLIEDEEYNHLADLNIAIIKRICKILEIECDFYRSYNLGITGQRTERLIKFCEFFQCGTYLSPVGSTEYLMKDGHFESLTVRLEFQNYTPISYSQMGTKEFVSHLSIVDILANIGAEETRDYIK